MAKKKKIVKKVKKTANKKSTLKKTKKTTVKKQVKKTIKKSANKKKKTSTKKIVQKKKVAKTKKRRAKKDIISAVNDQCFWIKEGPILKNLLDLRDALIEINKEQFVHHVNSMKNDFAVWVEVVLDDKKCADKIKKTKSSKAMMKAVEQALLEYKI
jgi:hypothetical protein